MLLGGWWYSAKIGADLKAIPAKLIKILPSELLVDKKADSRYDAQAVKAVAIGCLGDLTLVGSKLLFNKDIPNEMVNWIRAPSNSSMLGEYSGWIATLERCYGKRKFTTFDYDISQLY